MDLYRPPYTLTDTNLSIATKILINLRPTPNLTLFYNQLEWGALVKDAGSFKLSSSISEAQRDTLTRIQFKTAAYLRRLAQPLRCFV